MEFSTSSPNTVPNSVYMLVVHRDTYTDHFVIKRKLGQLFLATSPLYVRKLFFAHSSFANLNDVNGRLSVGNYLRVSSGAVIVVCRLRLNAFMTLCYRGVPEQTSPTSGQAEGLLAS